MYNADHASSLRSKFLPFSQNFNPTPLVSTIQSSSQVTSQTINTAIVTATTVQQPSTKQSVLAPTTVSQHYTQQQQPSSVGTSHQVTSSSPQLTPVLTDIQVSCILLGAEKIARLLPQREPRAQTSKKRTSRELEQVIAMSENDPRRMDEIRKYAAIYGRFDCKRRPEKPLTLHEVCVNEAAAQLCRLLPALLTRRDELFPLARQIVKDAGFGHSANIARYGGLISSYSQHSHAQRTIESETSESISIVSLSKRQRLQSIETASLPDYSRVRKVESDT